MECSTDKLIHVTRISDSSDDGWRNDPIVYVGDSMGDATALLAADYGVVIGDSPNLHRYAGGSCSLLRD